MKEFVITMFLLAFAIWPAIGQTRPTAPPNVSVGESTVLAVYPEMAEFSLNFPTGTITVVRFDAHGNDRQSSYTATFSRPDPCVWRADFGSSSWAEVNTVTGATTLSHNGKVEAFFPPATAGK